MITLPSWLQAILDISGTEQGIYSFGKSIQVNNVPKGFVAIAEDENGGGLLLSEKPDGVVYRVLDGEVDTYALNQEEFLLAIERDARWVELSENMPAVKPYWLGVIFKTKTDEGKWLTLGIKGEMRRSAMVIRFRVQENEMLVDVLDRELREALGISDYVLTQLADDGDVLESEPLFTAVLEVEHFDPAETIKDSMVEWMDLTARRIVN